MQKKTRLLIVEDEDAIRTGLVDVFLYHGYDVEAEADGRRGLERARRHSFDLIILDVMLPSMNGFDICNAIRATDREQPIIMLTAKTSDDDIVNGLRLGADDYIGKPFGVQELVLRVEAVLRRSRGAAAAEAQIDLGDGFVVDTRNLSAHDGKETLAFTRREVEILQYLYANRERPVARDELLSQVWGYRKHPAIETRTVDIHVAKLRRKIERDPKNPARLVTVRGAGYRLLAP